jgi:putative transposase
LLGLARSTAYYKRQSVSVEELALVRKLDELYTESPYYGARRLAHCLAEEGFGVGRKQVRRLMLLMGIEAIYPKPNLSQPNAEHKIYPYLLRDYTISRANEVWSSDITYIRLRGGFVYLTAVIDWFSRYVLSWRLSNSLDTHFCLEALEEALEKGRPEIFNTDQGCQFTSKEFTGRLKEAQVKISMDGRGRALDNIFVERLWRTVKYEEVYLKDYQNVGQARQDLAQFLTKYNQRRPHQSLEYRTPQQVHFALAGA